MSIEDPLPGWTDNFAAEPPEPETYELIHDPADEKTPRYLVVDAEDPSDGAWLSAEAMLSLGDWR